MSTKDVTKEELEASLQELEYQLGTIRYIVSEIYFEKVKVDEEKLERVSKGGRVKKC